MVGLRYLWHYAALAPGSAWVYAALAYLGYRDVVGLDRTALARVPNLRLEPGRVTVVYPAGYEVRDGSYRLVPNPTIPRGGPQAALQEMSRFYR